MLFAAAAAEQDIHGLIYALDIAVVIAVISGLFWIVRIKYEHDVSTSKKHPQGMLLAEFWKEDGRRPKVLSEIATNGWEIKAPAGHKCPRYFFLKSAKGVAKYPPSPLLPFSFLQVDVPTVSWRENDPEAIDPTEDRSKITVTAEMHDLIRDTDSLAAGQAINDEMAQTQAELQKALTNKLNPNLIYILISVAILAAGGAAVFAYQAYKSLNPG